MPPRKKINKIVNEEVEKKIKSFVNTANEKDCESSDEDYNIYVKSARNKELIGEDSVNDSSCNEVVVPTTKIVTGTVVKPKISKKAKIVPERESDPTDEIKRSNEKLYKMFDDYKNELNELRLEIVGGRNIINPQKTEIITPSLVDTRRAMMQLKFG